MLKGLAALTQIQLEKWVAQAKAETWTGRLPDYIPLLAKVNPDWVAVQVQQNNGQVLKVGDSQQLFVLMSVIKPFLLLFLLEHLGSREVFTRVGMEPSDQPFHSLPQLRKDQGFPRNPMINSGAIALASLLPGKDGNDQCQALCQWLNHLSGSHFKLDDAVLSSVRSLPNEANRAIASLMAESGYLGSVEAAIDAYNQICCLSGTVEDLAKLGTLLSGASTLLNPQNIRTVNALMLTCGLYETSGRFAVRIGLPTKSGVSGALLAIVPQQGAIACYSPAIDAAGNSVAGIYLLEQMTHTLDLSIFN